jgi:hypothetical protein
MVLSVVVEEGETYNGKDLCKNTRSKVKLEIEGEEIHT